MKYIANILSCVLWYSMILQSESDEILNFLHDSTLKHDTVVPWCLSLQHHILKSYSILCYHKSFELEKLVV